MPSIRLALCALLVLCVAGCADRQNAEAANRPEIELRGEVTVPEGLIVAAPVEGRVSVLAVQEGATVRAGDAIATLVNSSIERDLAVARSQVALAEQRMKVASAPAPRAAAKYSDETTQILKNREAKLARYRKLYETHDVSREELENAENEYAAARRDWLAERERRMTVDPATDTTILRLELERAQAEEALAQERKAQLSIAAPTSGIVTKVQTRAGAMLYLRDPLVEIANLSTVEVRAPIAPELTRYVRPGMPVEVKIFTVPPRRFMQPVKAVLPGAIVIELPNPDGVLQSGTNAVVTVKG